MVISIVIRLLYHEHKCRICDIARKYPQLARRGISCHAKKPIPANDNTVFDRCKYNPGRPRKVTECDERNILRMIPIYCRDIGNCFTSGKIKTEAGVLHISNQTVRHYLNKHSYYSDIPGRKVLSQLRINLIHVKFARKFLRRLTSEFWTEGISFYLDGVGFVHKTKPGNQALNHGFMAYRLKSGKAYYQLKR